MASVLVCGSPSPTAGHVVRVGVFNSRNGAHYPGHSQFEHHISLTAVVGPGMVVSSKLVRLNLKIFVRLSKKDQLFPPEQNLRCCMKIELLLPSCHQGGAQG